MESLNRIEKTYRALTSQGKKILRLFSGNPNDEGFLFPPEILKRAYQNYFDSQHYHPHPKGSLRAREAIAQYYGEGGFDLNPEQIFITAGSSESFFYLFSLLAKPGDNFLTPNPAYPLFDHIARLGQVELRHYPLIEEKGWRIDLDEIRKKTDSKTKGLVLISPHNPTGSVITADEIHKIVAWANERDLPLICDEVFSEFYFGPGPFPRPIQIGKPDLCFTLNGISKMFALPALKLGWIAVTGRPERVEAVLDPLELTSDTFLSCHTPIQEALPALFLEGRSFVENYRREVKSRRDLAIDLLKKSPFLKWVEPKGGFYLTVEVTKPLPFSEEDLVIHLMEEAGVFVHPGYFFDYEKGVHLVISYLCRPEILEEGLGRLTAFLFRL